ncbi:TPA: restriction endonuclease subunit S [Streptococcus suis]|nr:restriction endonuclease subunit S [Streptococcus suis]HEM5029988.1 restriction endonuclease subunit S [Streptococcus suis]HEM5203464.1 restriction endonuclease subunit S [Streptococcus suis]HEM5222013.1 restriction endonuclease subunit S [Streptococcus suis]HEM5224099.1 restriction endonuclease subunit S [Streptococcus suis]
MTRMKDSGIEWIGEVPEEWGITKFKYFLDTNKGLTITKENLIEDGIPVINYGQIHSKYGKSVSTDRDELPQVSANYLKFKQSLLKPGDFVFADTSEDIDGSGNFSTRIDDNGELFAGYHTIKAKLKNALEHDFRYFMHYFDSLAFRKQVQNKVSGIKVYSITQSILQETCLILPSLYEQTQIADFLDKKVAQLDSVKSLLEEQIKTLEDYRQSLIYETVTKGLDKTVPLKDSGVDWIGQIPEGWEVKNFKYVATIKDGTHDTPEYFVEGVPLITSKNLDSVQNRIDFDSAKNISYDDHIKISQRSDVKKGDILMPMIGTVGGATQVLVEKEFSIKNVALFKVAHDEALSRFLYYQLNSRWTNSQLSFMMSGGVQSFVSLNMLSQVKLIIPTSEEIKKINLFLDSGVGKINQMIAIKKEQIDNINKQRQTLIYDYVTGKRRV